MPTAAPAAPRSPRLTRGRAILVAVLLALALSACTPESRAAFDMINGSRGQSSRAPLKFHTDLWFKGQGWSDRMAQEQRLHHSNLADGLGHLPWRKLGENIAVAGSVAGAHNAFMTSQLHRDNILDPAFTHTAVGVTRDAFGRYWVAQEFMRL